MCFYFLRVHFLSLDCSKYYCYGATAHGSGAATDGRTCDCGASSARSRSQTAPRRRWSRRAVRASSMLSHVRYGLGLNVAGRAESAGRTCHLACPRRARRRWTWGRRLPGSVRRKKRAARAGGRPAPCPGTGNTQAGRTKTRRTSTHARGRRLLRRPRSRRPSRRRRRPTSSSRRAGAATLSSPSAARGVSPTSRTPSRRWQWLRDGDATIRERAARRAPAFVD